MQISQIHHVNELQFSAVWVLQVTKAMGRIVENVYDRLPKDSAVAAGLARVWSKGEKPFFQLITENEDTPKQVSSFLHHLYARPVVRKVHCEEGA